MKTDHLQHRHGGKIVALHAVAHTTFKGVASWHFVGDVDWSDDGSSRGVEIAPWAVCYDQANPVAKAEGDGVHQRMTDYLSKAGQWHDQKFHRDGRAYSWTPFDKDGREEFPVDADPEVAS